MTEKVRYELAKNDNYFDMDDKIEAHIDRILEEQRNSLRKQMHDNLSREHIIRYEGNKKIKYRLVGKEDKELYLMVQAKTAEKFGKNSQAYKTITNDINIKESEFERTGMNSHGAGQFYWNNELNLYLPNNQRVIAYNDLRKIAIEGGWWDWRSLTKYYNVCTSDLCLKTENSPWNPKGKQFLDSLVKQVKAEGFKDFSPKQPLVISGIEFVKDDSAQNKLGILPKLGKNTKIFYDESLSIEKHSWNPESEKSGWYCDLEHSIEDDSGIKKIESSHGKIYVSSSNLSSGVGSGTVLVECV